MVVLADPVAAPVVLGRDDGSSSRCPSPAFLNLTFSLRFSKNFLMADILVDSPMLLHCCDCLWEIKIWVSLLGFCCFTVVSC